MDAGGGEPGTSLRMDIFIFHADGTQRVNVTNSQGGDSVGYPAWSPDGTQLVFISYRFEEREMSACLALIDAPCNAEIVTMNTDGSGLQRLTFNPGWDIEPEWQPRP